VAFNSTFGSPGSNFLQNYLQEGQTSGQDNNRFAYSPQDSFSIAGTTPKNKFYSLSESQAINEANTKRMEALNGRSFGKRPALTPLDQMQNNFNDAIINTGNALGQDWSGVGAGGGAYRR
jgi:hypothetical protein